MLRGVDNLSTPRSIFTSTSRVRKRLGLPMAQLPVEPGELAMTFTDWSRIRAMPSEFAPAIRLSRHSAGPSLMEQGTECAIYDGPALCGHGLFQAWTAAAARGRARVDRPPRNDPGRPLDANLPNLALGLHAPQTINLHHVQVHLPAGFMISLAPGGQVEISTPPTGCPRAQRRPGRSVGADGQEGPGDLCPRRRPLMRCPARTDLRRLDC